MHPHSKHRQIIKAACYAVLGYCAIAGLGYGMLRAAQQTRQTLYGGTPVMAQLTQPADQTNAAGELTLGGGEWHITLPETDLSRAAEYTAQLPPCFGKLLLRLGIWTEKLADQTAEWSSGIYVISFCSL